MNTYSQSQSSSIISNHTQYMLAYQFEGDGCSSLYYVREPDTRSVMIFSNANQAARFAYMARKKPEIIDRLKDRCSDLPHRQRNNPVRIRWFVREAPRDSSEL